MESPRLRILQFLQRRGRASVEQLAWDVGLASATVRRHLDILQRDHLIAYDLAKKRTGRPEHSFYLTEEGQDVMPKGYDRLLSSVLQELAILSQPGAAVQAGEELDRSLLQRAALQTVRSNGVARSQDTLDGRITRLQNFLEAEGYFPEVEHVNGSLRIGLRNCPFRRVAMENPAICAYDNALLSAMLGTEVIQEQSIRNGDIGCCFVTASDYDEGQQHLSR